MRRRRCLFPADGFYEWKDEGTGAKRPFCLRPKDRYPVAFAGLWECWTGPNGEEVETAAIITTNASRDIANLHSRMPVVIAPDAYDLWLDCARCDALTASALLTPAPERLFEAYEVSPAVNRTANEGPELIEPVRPREAQPPARATLKPRKSKDERQPSLFDDL